jgi:HD-like signal output (HDOD) protein
VEGPIRKRIEQLDNLPTLPAALSRVLELASDPDTSALDLAQVIATDQSLSASLLRVVNSAAYGFYRRIDSVASAVVVLGFNEVRNLAFASTSFNMFPGMERSSLDRPALWRHSLASAMALDRCAKAIGLPPEGSHFLAGLLHDIGKVVLDTLETERFDHALRRARTEGIPLRLAEEDAFGIDHGEAGGLLGEQWHLPPAVVEAIRHHQSPESARNYPTLARLTALASFIAHEAGMGDPLPGGEHLFPAESVAKLDILEDDWRAIAGELKESADRIDDLLGALFEA